MSAQTTMEPSSRRGATLGTNGDIRRRLLLHYAPLAVASTAVFLVFMYSWPFTNFYPTGDILNGSLPREFPAGKFSPMDGPPGAATGNAPIRQATDATGYVALGLGALTLLLGPANLMLRRRNPVSSYLRRDIGIAAVIASCVHVVLGFQIHGTGDLLNYFYADGSLRTNSFDSFGLGNWTGLAALVIVVGLLAISTDGSIRELRGARWKNLQRLNYAAFALMVLHAFFYGALSRASAPFTLLLLVLVFGVFVGQAVGVRLWMRRNAAKSGVPA